MTAAAAWCISSQDDARAAAGRSAAVGVRRRRLDGRARQATVALHVVKLPHRPARYIRCGDLEFFSQKTTRPSNFGDGRDVDELAKLATRGFECRAAESEGAVRRRRVGLRFVWAVVLRPEHAALLAPDALKTRDLDPMAPKPGRGRETQVAREKRSRGRDGVHTRY